jgi:hypothetical protein
MKSSPRFAAKFAQLLARHDPIGAACASSSSVYFATSVHPRTERLLGVDDLLGITWVSRGR